MSILKDFVDAISALAKDTTRAKIEEYPNDPDQRIVLKAGGYDVLKTPRGDPSSVEHCFTSEDFAARVKTWLEAPAARKEVFVNGVSAEFVIDEQARKSVLISFGEHPIWTSIATLSGIKVFDQASAVRFLRTTLGGCVPSEIVNAFRELNWESLKTVRGSVQRVSMSLDSDLIQNVQGAAAKVEEIKVVPPLFLSAELVGITFPTAIQVEFDVVSSKIGFQLVPGAVERARELQTNAVYQLIVAALDEVGAAGVHVIRGWRKIGGAAC